jgi:hypothetical protein
MDHGFIDEGQNGRTDRAPLEDGVDWIARRLFRGQDVDESPPATTISELNDAVDLGKQGIVFSTADVVAREEFRPSLAHQDRATGHCLAAEPLDPEVLGVRVPAVAAGALSFFVSHDVRSLLDQVSP